MKILKSKNQVYISSLNLKLQVDGDFTLKLKSLKMCEDLSF